MEVFCLKSNTSENRRSDFLALGLMILTDGIGDTVLLWVNISVVGSIVASEMALYCWLSSLLPEGLYKFLMFYRYLCSYKSLLLNGWSTPMGAICCFVCSDYTNPLIMTHLCSNDSISRIKLITFFYELEFSHSADRAVLR